MAGEKDKQDFEKFQVLYRKALDNQVGKEELEEMERLKISLKPKLTEFLYDDNGDIIYSVTRTGVKLSIPARIGFQNHHIIHYHDETSSHPIWEKAGMTIDDSVNFLQIPNKAAAYILDYPEMPVHEGPHVFSIREGLLERIEKIFELGKQNSWGQNEYKKALIGIIYDEREKCIKDPNRLNKTAQRDNLIVSKMMENFNKKALAFVMTTSLALGGTGLASKSISSQPHPLVDLTIHKMVYGASKGISNYPFKPALIPTPQPKRTIMTSPPKLVSIPLKQRVEQPRMTLKPNMPGMRKQEPLMQKKVEPKIENPGKPLLFKYRPHNVLQPPKPLKFNNHAANLPKSTTQSYKGNSSATHKSTFSQAPLKTQNNVNTKVPNHAQRNQTTPPNVKQSNVQPNKTNAAILKPQQAEKPRNSAPSSNTKTSAALQQSQQIKEQARRQQQQQAQQAREQARRQQQLQAQQAREQARRQQQQQAQQLREQARLQQQRQLQQMRDQARLQQQRQLQQAREQARLQQQQAIRQQQAAIRQQQLQVQRQAAIRAQQKK